MATTSGPASNEPPTEVEIELQEAVRAEERLLDAAPSLEGDGPRVRAELDAGPTEQTAITANLIQESLIHGPALANFDRRNRNEDGNRSE